MLPAILDLGTLSGTWNLEFPVRPRTPRNWGQGMQFGIWDSDAGLISDSGYLGIWNLGICDYASQLSGTWGRILERGIWNFLPADSAAFHGVWRQACRCVLALSGL